MIKQFYKNVRVIDVTLRDGGYLTNFSFSRDLVKNHLMLCNKAKIDYVEIGYRNGPRLKFPYLGESGLTKNDYIEFCRKNINTKIDAMVHPTNVNFFDFREMKNCGLDAVRIVFFNKDPELTYRTIEDSLKNNLETFVNIIRISEYSNLNPLAKIIIKLSSYPLKAIYLADSNGHLYPEITRDYIKQLRNLTTHNIGFHPHDNLHLAHANIISAIESGATFIDSSILGLGKGKGNARTEDLIAFLSMMSNSKYNLRFVIELYKLWLNQDNTNELLTTDKSIAILSGMKNLNAEELKNFQI